MSAAEADILFSKPRSAEYPLSPPEAKALLKMELYLLLALAQRRASRAGATAARAAKWATASVASLVQALLRGLGLSFPGSIGRPLSAGRFLALFFVRAYDLYRLALVEHYGMFIPGRVSESDFLFHAHCFDFIDRSFKEIRDVAAFTPVRRWIDFLRFRHYSPFLSCRIMIWHRVGQEPCGSLPP